MAEPQEPKKAVTAFFDYLNTNRPQLVKELAASGKPAGAGGISKFASEKWKGMSVADKKPYEDKAVAAKAVHAKAMEAFKAAGGQAGKRRAEKKEKKGGANDKNSAKKARKEKMKGAPKRPAGGGFGRYVVENRAKIMASLPPGSNKITDTSKVAGAQWKALSADKQEPYKKLYIEAQAVWKIEFEKWKKEQAEKGEAVGDGDEAEDGEDGEDDEDDEEDE